MDTFFRTIPPDDHQAQAMVDVVVYFWMEIADTGTL